MQLFKAGTKLFKVFCFNRIDTSKDHRLYLFKAFYSLGTRILHRGDGIAHFNFGGSLNATNNITDISAVQLLTRRKFHFEYAYFVSMVALLRIDKDNVFIFMY